MQDYSTSNPHGREHLSPNIEEAFAFLTKLSSGPWMLTAIIPDGTTTTQTVDSRRAVEQFIRRHNADKNIYYAPNPTKTAMSKRAGKTDIARVEYFHVDADPGDGESPEEFKAKMMEKIAAFPLSPTLVVDSGNGIQLLMEPSESVKLNGAESIADVEARNHSLALAFDASPSTRNVDRILRLPGTVNHPNRHKRERGRVACMSRLVAYNDIMHPLEVLPYHREERSASSTDSRPSSPEQIRAALSVLDSRAVEHRCHLAIGCGIYKELGATPGEEILREWYRAAGEYDEQLFERQWHSIIKADGYGWSIGTLFWLADRADPQWRNRSTSSDDLDGLTDEQKAEIRRLADRKSTRLNSSHEWISYAVFCLKKKKKIKLVIKFKKKKKNNKKKI